MELALTILGEPYAIRGDEARAPRTLARLQGLLPMPTQLHTPKIAGSHIYWHAPFVADPEGEVDVLSAPPGAFLYWPVRQFLEITYAPLQAETAEVTLLGQYDGPIERIASLAHRLQAEQGVTRFEGTLSLRRAGALTPIPAQDAASLPAPLCVARDQLWAGCPDDVARLRDSRALMHPAGPVFMAESEARVLHETLWWLRSRREQDRETQLRYAGALALNKAAVRLRDFCHLHDTSQVLFDLEAAFGRPEIALEPLIELAIVTVGRLAAWLDLQIPWGPVNSAFRAALDG